MKLHSSGSAAGVEIGGDVIDSDRSLISDQVASGLAVRMAILFELLAHGDPREPAEGPVPIGESA